jgi:hypothetical protein
MEVGVVVALVVPLGYLHHLCPQCFRQGMGRFPPSVPMSKSRHTVFPIGSLQPKQVTPGDA